MAHFTLSGRLYFVQSTHALHTHQTRLILDVIASQRSSVLPSPFSLCVARHGTLLGPSLLQCQSPEIRKYHHKVPRKYVTFTSTVIIRKHL
jgi:hypothetical protein